MQSFVYSVFVVVSSVIATLLSVGLAGVIILLIIDGSTPSGSPGHENGVERRARPVDRNTHGAGTRAAHAV